MDNKRPLSHEKRVTGSSSVNKRGSGLGTGPVGKTNGRQSSPRPAYSSNRPGGNGPSMPAGGKSGCMVVAVIVIFVIGMIIKTLFGGQGYGGTAVIDPNDTGNNSWQSIENNNKLDTTVAEGARAKRTQILGNGQDKVTIMVYMCGTDLESKHGMATNDIKEMLAASLNDKINLIIYTGGCKQWNNNLVSSSKNQIYQVVNGNLKCLEDDMGSDSMTDPKTLATFIQYCKENFPANRNDLIFWDHGGGSISGFGYDEKYAKSGSMNLAGIDKALKNGGVTFDFIGFDACLMATLETALTMDNYADYLIASEETEPGVGWYYTNWLTELAANTSKPTIEIGKRIVDDFVDVCASKCKGQLTTLSVVDLAELEKTVPSELIDFAKATNKLITENDYKKVSDARYKTREFATSSKIDQVDLVDLAENMNTKEGRELVSVILSAVKYNRTSANMTNAYGLAIYFPYKKASRVTNATYVYDQIGMDDEYSRCIKEFAGLEVCGQQATGGSTTPVQSLTGGGTVPSGSSGGSSDAISSILSSLLGSGLGFVSDRGMSMDDTNSYISRNYFDPSKLVWTKDGDKYKIVLSESQWDLVEGLDLNVFIDDGKGFIDLGLDNQMDYDQAGNLIGEYDGTWLAINNQVVAYYHTDTVGDANKYTMTGYIPAMLNGERVEILVVFDNENPYGYIAGARTVYKKGETETIAKSMLEIKDGDKIDFICDYYDYAGNYQDSYYLGSQMTVNGPLTLSYVDISSEKAQASYRFVDIYQQCYWTEIIP